MTKLAMKYRGQPPELKKISKNTEKTTNSYIV
jgi:hypothetical protein